MANGKISPLILLSAFFMQSACVEEHMQKLGPAKIGSASMTADGTLTVRMFAAPEGAQTQIYRTTDPYYDQTVQSIGGIRPGEAKDIFESVGQVTMKADRSLSFVLITYSKSGEQIRKVGEARPGSSNYDTLLSRVGGLHPGETKPLPAQ